MLCLDVHNRSQEECLVSPVAISRAGCIYSFSNSIHLFNFSPLGLSWDSQETGSCSSAAGFCRRILSFLCPFSPSLFPVACSLLCLSASSGQPPTTNCIHAPETSFLHLKLLNTPLFVMEEPRNPQAAFFCPQLPFSLTTHSKHLTAWQGQIHRSAWSPHLAQNQAAEMANNPLFIPSELTWGQRLLYHLQASPYLSLPITTCSSVLPERSKVSLPELYQSHRY